MAWFPCNLNSNLGGLGGIVLKNVNFNSTYITTENLYKADISTLYLNYKKLSVKNMFFEWVSCSQERYYVSQSNMSYDANTGIITANNIALWGSQCVLNIILVDNN